MGGKGSSIRWFELYYNLCAWRDKLASVKVIVAEQEGMGGKFGIQSRVRSRFNVRTA